MRSTTRLARPASSKPARPRVRWCSSTSRSRRGHRAHGHAARSLARKGHEPLAETRTCETCDDASLRATAADLVNALDSRAAPPVAAPVAPPPSLVMRPTEAIAHRAVRADRWRCCAPRHRHRADRGQRRRHRRHYEYYDAATARGLSARAIGLAAAGAGAYLYVRATRSRILHPAWRCYRRRVCRLGEVVLMRKLAVALLSLTACTRSAPRTATSTRMTSRTAQRPTVAAAVCAASTPTARRPTDEAGVLDQSSCVQCALPDRTSACTGTTPVCSADHSCRACDTTRVRRRPVPRERRVRGCLGDRLRAGGRHRHRVYERRAVRHARGRAPDRPLGHQGHRRDHQRPADLVHQRHVPDLRHARRADLALEQRCAARGQGTANVAIHDLRFTGGASDAIQQSETTSTLRSRAW